MQYVLIYPVLNSRVMSTVMLLWRNNGVKLLVQDHPVKKHKLAKELSDLVNYCVSTRFQDFQVSQQKRMY